jgi:hypothetical protein
MIDSALMPDDSMDELTDDQIDVVIVDDESTTSEVVDLDELEESDDINDDDAPDVTTLDHFTNLVHSFSENQLRRITDVIQNRVDTDTTSRKDWLDQTAVGYKLLGLSLEERMEPWPGACGASSSLMIETLTRFVAEVGGETWPASGPVRTSSSTKDDKVMEASSRVEASMNHYLCNTNRSARGEHELTLFHCGLSGSAFKKIYPHPASKAPLLEFVAADHVILPSGASNLRTAPYYVHKLRMFHEEYLRAVADEMYVDIELEEPTYGGTEEADETPDRARDEVSGVDGVVGDNRHTFYEAHIDLTTEYINDAQPAPCRFIVTMDQSSSKVLSIYRGWAPEDATRTVIPMMVQYTYMYGPGPYGLGLVHMLGNNTMASTGVLRSLIDAGTLSNLPAGFKSKGLRMENDTSPLRPGEWRDVSVPMGKIAENFMVLPYKEPSPTLMNLYNTLGEESRRFVATADLSVQDMPSNTGSMGMLGILEKSAKYQSAIITRIFAAMCDELERVKALLGASDLVPDQAKYPDQATRADYQIAEIVPVADANASSLAQRMSKLQAARDLTQTAQPGLINERALYLEGFRIIGLERPERFLAPDPQENQPQPMDPIAENMGILNIAPVKAFPPQDHEAHIKCHQAFMQDPNIQGLLQNSPQAQSIIGAMDAHLREHAAFAYMRRIEQALGTALPDNRDGMDPSVAGLVAEASDIALGKSQQRAAAEQAAAAAQDPVVQQQEKELGIKEKEAATKATKVANDHTEAMIDLAMKGAEYDDAEAARKLDLAIKAKTLASEVKPNGR